jgi:N-dimethylarginine dimethylaminohydrolase
MKYGSHSETGAIKSILLKHPKDAFGSQEDIDAGWRQLHYTGPPEYRIAVAEFERFVELLQKQVPDIYYLPFAGDAGLDSIYVRDAALVTEKGAVLCNMGKKERRKEPVFMGKFLQQIGVPILGSIVGQGKLEGGDVVWLDDRTLAVGVAYRTNEEGIRQLRKLTAGIVDDIIPVPLPHWNGAEDCFHLMSIISPVDKNLAVVYSRLMPVPFRNYLVARGINMIEVPDTEYASMGCNVLAVAPRKCIVVSGNPVTKQKLAAEGVEVCEFDGGDLCFKGGGGPTCLTRPILRAC